MNFKSKIPLFIFFVSLSFLSGAQIVKEWYFFNGYNSLTAVYNQISNRTILSHDSLLFGFINETRSNGVFYAYKATHRQGLIKKTKFSHPITVNYAVDMCIDTTNKYIFYYAQTSLRPPLMKYSQGIVYKLDYDLNALDSSVISFGTIFSPTKILCKNNKLYVLGSYDNFFSEPLRTVVNILDANNLNLLNAQEVTGNDNSRYCYNAFFDNNFNLRIFLRQAGSNTGPLNYSQIIVDTNLVKVDSLCTFGFCNFGGTNMVRDDHGFTFQLGGYLYNSAVPYNTIHSYIIKTNENGDTIKTSFFYKALNSNNSFNYYGIANLSKLRSNGYLGLGREVNGLYQETHDRFFVLDSNLNIINQIHSLKYSTVQLTGGGGPTEIGQTNNRTYYLNGVAQDTTNVNLNIFYLMTIDSTAAIITPTATPGPTVSPEASWENITVYPNPTDGIVNIGLPVGNTYNLNIYNSLGQSLLNLQNLDVNRQVSLANLPEGVYHLVFYETGIKKSITKKVVVRH